VASEPTPVTPAQPPLRIHLSPPDVGPIERDLLLAAFDSNWIAPLGPHVDGFEDEVVAWLHAAGAGAGDPWHAVALSSGTAGLHLALLDLGIGPGDEVVTSTFTFAATANAITYVGADPVFVDVDPVTWQLDPALVAEVVADRVAAGRPPAAVVTVDLYGIPADHRAIRAVCESHGIPIIEDAAESLGSVVHGRAAGTLGDVGVFSFNGNKIITTSGGGMVVTPDPDQAARLRFLATQARDPAPHYQHSVVGYNYRLSNLLAAVGRGQLASLDAKVARRQAINAGYRDRLGDLDGVTFLAPPPATSWNSWLTCLVIDPAAFGADNDRVRVALRELGIEARPLWKPMHLQPVFAGADVVDRGVASALFADGICLPSGSSLVDDDVDEIAGIVAAQAGTGSGAHVAAT
jgi:dTDP-4-amino-4,6-dideoxygalactose transaminase